MQATAVHSSAVAPTARNLICWFGLLVYWYMAGSSSRLPTSGGVPPVYCGVALKVCGSSASMISGVRNICENGAGTMSWPSESLITLSDCTALGELTATLWRVTRGVSSGFWVSTGRSIGKTNPWKRVVAGSTGAPVLGTVLGAIVLGRLVGTTPPGSKVGCSVPGVGMRVPAGTCTARGSLTARALCRVGMGRAVPKGTFKVCGTGEVKVPLGVVTVVVTCPVSIVVVTRVPGVGPAKEKTGCINTARSAHLEGALVFPLSTILTCEYFGEETAC
jgi:hypothetical protein